MKRDEILVSTEWLSSHLSDPSVRIADLRWALSDPLEGERQYEQGHIPGAVYLDWLRDLSDPDDAVAGQIAPPERFVAAMARAGIGDDTLVIAYDDNIIFMAARLAWLFHYYGHDNLRILDGGFPTWLAEGRPVETARPRPAAARFTPKAQPALRMTKDDVLAVVWQGDRQLFDCRMDSTWLAAGAHIPGASRLPAPTLLEPSGTWRSTEEIAQIAGRSGADPDQPIVLYCGGGISASAAYVALRMAGYRNLAVYDGSWSEWSADPSTPKETH
jgi:thiosulfate/3-mercaptopyruvate sulfurtransferase